MDGSKFDDALTGEQKNSQFQYQLWSTAPGGARCVAASVGIGW